MMQQSMRVRHGAVNDCQLLTKRTACLRNVPQLSARRRQAGRLTIVTVQASSSGGDAAPNPQGDQGPQAVSLLRRLPGPGITFVLAGFLKIVTIGGLAYTAPVDAVRTAAGKLSPYLMVPIGLAMCWIAKVIVDNELQESKRFMVGMVVGLVALYFGLYRLLYRYDPRAELPQGTRAAVSGPVARLRAQAGDREIGRPAGQGGVLLHESRAYQKEEGRGKGYDDLAYYEGTYASQKVVPEDSTAVLETRNPVRQHYRRS